MNVIERFMNQNLSRVTCNRKEFKFEKLTI